LLCSGFKVESRKLKVGKNKWHSIEKSFVGTGSVITCLPQAGLLFSAFPMSMLK